MRDFRFAGKGLSIKQPWADAIAFAGKDIENRPWRTHYRGPLAIHASGTIDRAARNKMQKRARGGKGRPLIDLIDEGRQRYRFITQGAATTSRIVAIAMLVDCVEKSLSPWWVPGEFGWVISGVVPVEPIPWIGGLSLWDCRLKYSPLRLA